MKNAFAYLLYDITKMSYPSFHDFVDKDMDEDKFSMTYGVAWATEFYNTKGDEDYFPAITEFCNNKVRALVEEKDNKPTKVAKLVTFEITTRVVVNANKMAECEEEDAIEHAIEKVKKETINDLCFDHVVDVYNDTECPYGTLETDKE